MNIHCVRLSTHRRTHTYRIYRHLQLHDDDQHYGGIITSVNLQSTQAPHSKRPRLLHPESKCQPALLTRQEAAANINANNVKMSSGAGFIIGEYSRVYWMRKGLYKLRYKMVCIGPTGIANAIRPRVGNR